MLHLAAATHTSTLVINDHDKQLPVDTGRPAVQTRTFYVYEAESNLYLNTRTYGRGSLCRAVSLVLL